MGPEARKATEMRKNIIITKQERDEDQMTRVCLLSLQTRYKMVSSETTSTENNQGFFTSFQQRNPSIIDLNIHNHH